MVTTPGRAACYGDCRSWGRASVLIRTLQGKLGHRPKRPEAQQAAGDFRAKAAAGFKATAARTTKENRAAVLAARLQERAGNMSGTARGERAYDRAQGVLKAYPGAAPLADQVRRERQLEARQFVARTMRTSMSNATRVGAGLPPTRSERIANLLAQRATQAARSADWRSTARNAQAAAKEARSEGVGSALDRYRQQVKTAAREKERSDLSAMTARVRDNMATGRAALAGAPKPRGGLERTVVRGFVDRKASVQNVRAIAKSGDFFVHKSGGFGSGYGVTHRPSGTTIYQSHSASAARAAMDGVAKSGGKILSRIEGGDIRAAKALSRYTRGLESAKFYNAAHRKYDKRA